MNKAIVIGASSGMGRELAKMLGERGWAVGLMARRFNLLNDLAGELPHAVVRTADVSEVDEARAAFARLVTELGGVDLVIVSAGTGHLNPDLEWELERDTIDVNVRGFAALAGAALNHFIRQGSGRLVAISSIAALRGGAEAPAYNASKAFVSNYLEGLRQKVFKLGLPIGITDIQPGFVDTAMAQGEGLFWVRPPAEAARQILAAVEKGRKHAYVTRRWRLVAWAFKLLPDFVYNRLGERKGGRP